MGVFFAASFGMLEIWMAIVMLILHASPARPGPSFFPITDGLAARYAARPVLQIVVGTLFVAVLLILPDTSWMGARARRCC